MLRRLLLGIRASLVSAIATALVGGCGGKDGGAAPAFVAADAGDGVEAGPGAEDVPAPVEPVPSTWGAPVTGPARAWTWIDVPDSRCMNDTPTGFGVNLAPGAKRVVVYLEGGGACFDSITCVAGTFHQTGFNRVTFDAEMAATGSLGIFDRGNVANPFRDDSWVFVPYCTGDVHAGANARGALSRKHFGYVNIGQYLKRIVPTFTAQSGITDVVLAGSSAGGIGAAFNFDRVQRSFGAIPVHLLDDAGPVMGSDWLKPCLRDKMRDTWRLDLTIPADCAACAGSFGALFPFLAAKYPASRMALVTGLWDDVIRTFMGAGYADCSGAGVMLPTDFAAGLDALHAGVSATPNFCVFYMRSNKHTWLLDQPLGVAAAATVPNEPLTEFLRGVREGGAAFRDVVP
ncbi:MAG: pectin acetylesterase-family hydrolase [Polyangiaceae bacterium]